MKKVIFEIAMCIYVCVCTKISVTTDGSAIIFYIFVYPIAQLDKTMKYLKLK